MKIISWNVNGLRAAHRKDALDAVWALEPDVLCLQETKAEKAQLPHKLQQPDGYHAYFSSSQVKKGYSGTAMYAKTEPDDVWYDLGRDEFDQEGRMVAARFGDLAVFNVYFPNGGAGNKRVPFKMDFYDTFLQHIEECRANGYDICVAGDVNTAHTEIDLARPKENADNTGFLPEERAWLDTLQEHGYVDVFRHYNPEKRDAYTYWDMKTAARERNVGWRLDYFWVNEELIPKVSKIAHRTEIYGSDHCPIVLELQL